MTSDNETRRPKHRSRVPVPFERNEIASSLYETLQRSHNGEWVAVRLTGDSLWEVVKPRSQEAILAACETSQEKA